mmetsp:Transcript_24821/g.42021  ORF Transcript_24821/g.42021 Transcript_24821/m.42021 type:complete len:139 (-) Transcript_24821:186-602(-)
MDEEALLDKERLNNIVESVIRDSSRLDVSLDDSCQKLMLDYLNEVTLAALEQAALLAQHRGSSNVEEEDVQLVLGKKLDIPVPGAVRKEPLYKNSYHILSPKFKPPATKNKTSSSSGVAAKSTGGQGTKRGTKRKSIQ